jgi:hypothetical protein
MHLGWRGWQVDNIFCPNLLEEFLKLPVPPETSYARESKFPALVGLLREQFRDKARREEQEAERFIAILENIPPRAHHRL